MGDVKTTIAINAVDNTASTFSKLEQNAKKVYETILKATVQNSKLGQDTLQHIEKEIEAYKRKAQIQLETHKQAIRHDFEQNYSKEGIEKKRAAIKEQELREISTAKTPASKFDVTQKYSAQYDALNASGTKEGRESANKELETSIKGFEDEQKNTNLILKDLVEDLKGNIFTKLENQSKASIREDAVEALSGSASLSPEEKAARLAAAHGGEKGGEGEHKKESMFKELLKFEVAKRVFEKAGEIGGDLAGAEDGEEFVADMMSGIPIAGAGVSTAMKRHLREKLQQDKARNALRGTIGRNTAGVGGSYNSLAGAFGMDISEVIPQMTALAKARGSNANIFGETKNMIGAGKAFNLSDESLLSSASAHKFDVNNVDVAKTVGMVASILGSRQDLMSGKVDTSRMEELLQANNALTEDQLSILETSDAKSTTGVLKAFYALGGEDRDPKVAQERILKMNQALRAPGNEYQQAQSFAALASMHPGMSYTDMMAEQEKGIYSKGLLSKTLGNLEGQYGSDEHGMGALALSKRFGLSVTQSQAFLKAYKKDRTMFDNMGEEGIQSYMTAGDINKVGSSNVSKIERQQAEASDAFGVSATKGFTTMVKQSAEELSEAFDMAKNAVKDFVTGATPGNNTLKAHE